MSFKNLEEIFQYKSDSENEKEDENEEEKIIKQEKQIISSNISKNNKEVEKINNNIPIETKFSTPINLCNISVKKTFENDISNQPLDESCYFNNTKSSISEHKKQRKIENELLKGEFSSLKEEIDHKKGFNLFIITIIKK